MESECIKREIRDLVLLPAPFALGTRRMLRRGDPLPTATLMSSEGGMVAHTGVAVLTFEYRVQEVRLNVVWRVIIG